MKGYIMPQSINSVGTYGYPPMYAQLPQQGFYTNPNPINYPQIEYDSFESSQPKESKTSTILSTAALTTAVLWLWKGKGFSKILKFFKGGQKATKSSQKANQILQKHKTNVVSQEVSATQAQKKVNEVIKNDISVPKPEEPSKVIRNIETQNTNIKNRNLVEKAVADTPTPAQQAAYNESIAYVEPTKKEAKVIQQINKKAATETQNAQRIENNISESQAKALKETKKTMAAAKTSDLTGVFKTKEGYTVKLNNGNLESIITPDGRLITKPKTLYKYQDKVNLKELQKA